MYKSRQIVNDTGTYAENIERLKETLTETDVLVIGAGAGISTAAGFTYSGERFKNTFTILRKSMDSMICIQEGFTLMILSKSTGLIGADT